MTSTNINIDFRDFDNHVALKHVIEGAVADEGNHSISAQLQWFSPPRIRPPELSSDGLCIYPDAGKDFWQKTHYPKEYAADSAHFLYVPIQASVMRDNPNSSLRLQTRVVVDQKFQYDQAGLCVRQSADSWLKTSCEYESAEEPPRLGAVNTNFGFSDWSTQDWKHDSTEVTYRVDICSAPSGGYDLCVCVTDSNDSDDISKAHWRQLRIAHMFPVEDAKELMVGIYACSPNAHARGFKACFRYLRAQMIEKSPIEAV